MNLRRINPLLSKTGKRVYAGEEPLPAYAGNLKELEENVMFVGPLGPLAQHFGFDPNTMLLYFFIDPADKSKMIDITTGRDTKNVIPLFPMRRAGISGPGTIKVFWSKPAAKKWLAGALQFIPQDDKIILTHMAVKPKWQRNRLNTLMIEIMKDEFPNRKVVFHDPTEVGYKFMKFYGGEEYRE